jgi:hypothetical protein
MLREKNYFRSWDDNEPLFIFLSFPYKANSGAYDLISNVKFLFLFTVHEEKNSVYSSYTRERETARSWIASFVNSHVSAMIWLS